MKKLTLVDTEMLLSRLGDDTVMHYDAMRLVVCLQGLLNRESPRIFLLWDDSDSFWLRYISREGSLLDGYERQTVTDFSDFMALFADEIAACGLVAWDYSVPATANAALTVCGVEGFLPVRGDDSPKSIMSRVMRATGATVRLDLRGMFTGHGFIPDTERPTSGSAKCDTYLWALDKYASRTNPALLFYTIDGTSWAPDRPYYPDLGNAFIYNHDYAVSKRAFVFDLSSFDDELPCDDPGQPLGADLRTMKEILMYYYDRVGGQRMITVCGFNPWQEKYTRHKQRGKHGEVEAEWRFTEILSAYNCIKDADAYGYCGLTNASVYTHYPLKPKYSNRRPQNAPPYDPNKTYILFYVGDYDAAAWTSRFIPKWYADPALGKNPLMWCFNPNLSDRIPQAFDFIYENFTQNDYFEAGDSGAGYNNPRLLYEPRVHSTLPSGVETFIAHNKHYFEQFDCHSIGFVINGNYPTDERQMKDLARFADVGVGYNGGIQPSKVVDGTVFMGHTSDICAGNTPVAEVLKTVFGAIDRSPSNKKFHIFRTILTSPTHHDAILQAMKTARPQAHFELLDVKTFFSYAKYAIENGLTY